VTGAHVSFPERHSVRRHSKPGANRADGANGRRQRRCPQVYVAAVWKNSSQRASGISAGHRNIALTVVRDQRVHVHEMCDAVARVLGDTRDDHSGIAMADENDPGEVVTLQ
jgi:hypothetical protein